MTRTIYIVDRSYISYCRKILAPLNIIGNPIASSLAASCRECARGVIVYPRTNIYKLYLLVKVARYF